MKIVVLGAGVIGVSTAYELGRQGHEVTVIDKASSVASGASFANGAQLSFSYVDPFANPMILKSLPRFIAGGDPAIKLGLSLRPAYYAWAFSFLKNCRRKDARKNLENILKQSLASQKAFDRVQNEVPGIKLRTTDNGKILLARSKEEMSQMTLSAKIKSDMGLPVNVLYREQIIDQETALLDWQENFIGGSYSEEDRVIESIGFCEELKKASEKKYAVQYLFNQTINELKTSGDSITSVLTDQNEFSCNAAVVCLGNDANPVLKTLGLGCRIYSMRGYSLTLPVTEHSPSVSVTDPQSKMVFANLGTKIRIAGFLDANLPESKTRQRGTQLLESAKKLWPSAADYDSESNFWTGTRPMTPSGLPIVGASPVKGLFYNLGHGSFGLTLANGSATRIAKLIGKAVHDTDVQDCDSTTDCVQVASS
jgi:D-amino-acid dehydrogenase